MPSYRVELELSPAQAADEAEVRRACARKLKLPEDQIHVEPRRRSIDARRGQPRVQLQLEVYHQEPPRQEAPTFDRVPDRLHHRVLIVGAGPAGYFAALELLLRGVKPVVIERGKDTLSRRYDLRAIMQDSRVNPNSNYCFGEGGAGTYSDGKLYTRSDKRGDVGTVLRWFVEHGARRDILVDAHPHIGSNRLPGVVESLRTTIRRCGGEVLFDRQVTGLMLQDGRLRGVIANGAEEIAGDAVILATGHSARDVYRMLHAAGVRLEWKPFALGVRIEHPQPLIDEIQYRQMPRDPNLPAASYRLAREGVYSFCMCPGGLIVPAATAPGEIVVNGMSMSGRNSRWANSGIVTGVVDEDIAAFAEHGPLAGLEFQAAVERAAFAASGDDSQRAPAQRLLDFLKDRPSQDLPRCSYVPGVVPYELKAILPSRITAVLRHGLDMFGRFMRGFHTKEAILVGVESRTSSPVRIPRTDRLHHADVVNLFPCGEGAGYAGGIVSAALDGQRVARVVAESLGEEVAPASPNPPG